MSSAVISTSAALRRHFLFDADPELEMGSHSTVLEGLRPQKPVARAFQSTIKTQPSTIPLGIPASHLATHPAPEMASSGVTELDALTGGLPRGCLTEICGPISSGRTTLFLAALAAATERGEYCAVIDASDALDPLSLSAAAIDLDRLLWVRCGENSPPKNDGTRNEKQFKKRAGPIQSEHALEQVLRATDLLLESGGFGLIILDLAGLPPQSSHHIPLTTWFRFRRAVEHKSTILLAIEQQPIAGSCSSLLLKLGVLSTQNSEFTSNTNSDPAIAHDATQHVRPAHSQLLTGLEINVELIRSRIERKPVRSIAFATRTAWAG